jgi:hypothetical protein
MPAARLSRHAGWWRHPEGRRAHHRLLGRQPKVPQIAFKPDWTRYAKAAPFRRNDQLLAVLPIGDSRGAAGEGERIPLHGSPDLTPGPARRLPTLRRPRQANGYGLLVTNWFMVGMWRVSR